MAGNNSLRATTKSDHLPLLRFTPPDNDSLGCLNCSCADFVVTTYGRFWGDHRGCSRIITLPYLG
jgi:hypothetical protein